MGSERLLFDGDIELLDVAATEDGYWFEAVEGVEFGQPVPVMVILTSLLRDGALVAKSGDDNREVSIPFRVRGADLLALAEGEKRLGLALGKRTTLEWTPPDGYGPTTVFDVLTSSLDVPPHDDLAELRNQRTYTLKLTCLPFGRSVDKIVDNAGTPPSTGGTVLLNCQSTSGWSAIAPSYPAEYVVDTTVFAEGTGSLRSRVQSYSNLGGDFANSLVWDKVSGLSLSTGTGGYLSVAIRPEWSMLTLNIYMTTTASGRQQVSSPLAVKQDANGFVHYVWPVAAGLTVTALEFKVQQQGPIITSISTNPHHVWYDDVELLPAATTDHQIVKHLEVQGSARTTGSLHIAGPSDVVALGQVLAITAPSADLPDGFQPDVRRWVVSGSTTPDSTALGGSYFTGGSTFGIGGASFEVPVSMLAAGPYTMVALVKSASDPLTVGVEAQLKSGGTLVGPTSVANVSTPNPVSNVWQFIAVGTVYLPPVPLMFPDSSSVVRIRFSGSCNLADLYMVPQNADFSIVDCGTGTVSASGASSNLWIDSPSAEQPQGGWWRGPASDRTNAKSAWSDAKKPGVHTFNPGALTAFLVSTGAQGPTLALEYYPAWITNAAL